ncbi:MAG: HAD family hydrolase [Coleofasciculaceae cyanobacterium]
MLNGFRTILLDMNETFMFGADRFNQEQDYSIIYYQLGGTLESSRVNSLVRAAFDYLDIRYPDPEYQESFPSLQEAFIAVGDHEPLTQQDLDLLIETFARHELGYVPSQYSAAIAQLSKHFRLGLVVDIWAPKTLWINALNQCGVLPLCEAAFFSSDYGIVKPSPRPFLSVLEQMQANLQEVVFIGDSVRRDLGGAIAAGIACILVGGATHPSAFGCVSNLLELTSCSSRGS